MEAGRVVRVQCHNPGGRPQQLKAGWAKQTGLFGDFVSRSSKGARREEVMGGSRCLEGHLGLLKGGLISRNRRLWVDGVQGVLVSCCCCSKFSGSGKTNSPSYSSGGQKAEASFTRLRPGIWGWLPLRNLLRGQSGSLPSVFKVPRSVSLPPSRGFLLLPCVSVPPPPSQKDTYGYTEGSPGQFRINSDLRTL